MHRFLKLFLIAATVLVSASLWAQETYLPLYTDLLARLSFQSSAVARDEEAQRICIAVSEHGDYRMLRIPAAAETERREGKMSKEQFRELVTLLHAGDFRALPNDHGGLIRQESETFTAEIATGRESHWVHWLNPDGEKPFPDPIVKVVDWMKNFKPGDGESFTEAEYPDVCPPEALRRIQPSMAQNGKP